MLLARFDSTQSTPQYFTHQILHHFTFLINSLTHIWGIQPCSDKNTSKDNGFLAFLTMSEGCHNYHHSFQRNYCNGILWWQFDPTKWLIRSLSFINLTKNLYRTPIEYIETARTQILLSNTTKKLSQQPCSDTMIQQLQAEYETLFGKINDFSQAKRQWMEAHKNSIVERYDLDTLKNKAEILKQYFLQQKKDWIMLNASFA